MSTKRKSKSKFAHLLLADDQGNIYDHPDLLLAGQTWDRIIPVRPQQLIDAPDGHQLAFLPRRRPIGLDPTTGKTCVVDRFSYQNKSFVPHAVAAILPPAHLRSYLPAAQAQPNAPALPLRSYTACGFQDDKIKVAARRIDSADHWDPSRFCSIDWEQKTRKLLSKFPNNNMLQQLAHCATRYFCSTARNIFLSSYEGGLPISCDCNANCLGCISYQESTTSPQQRLSHPSSVKDIVEIAVYHLQRARPGMVSFGQGCEGEPLTQADRIREAIKRIRQQTQLGAIHMNTNGSMPEELDSLVAAGLQSVRVSLISARPQIYRQYHRANLQLASVESFVAQAVALGVYTSLNLLVFPGLNDRPQEVCALIDFLERTQAHMVQFRNVDIDPTLFINSLPAPTKPLIGIENLPRAIATKHPNVFLGTFNRFLTTSQTLT